VDKASLTLKAAAEKKKAAKMLKIEATMQKMAVH
jgi:hypothetical protein